METLVETATLRSRDDVVSCELAGGAALLDMRSSTYFSINPVGAHIWNQLQSGATLETLVLTVQQEFDTQGADVRQDVVALLDDLLKSDLVVAADESAS